MATFSSPHRWKILNGATSQADWISEAPQPDKVAVDGRSIQQLLAFAARFGELIRFYDLTDRPDGDWSVFFAEDPAIAWALQGALDLPEIETELRRLLALAREAGNREMREPPLERAMRAIIRLLRILDWVDPEGTDNESKLLWFSRQPRNDGLTEPLGLLHLHLERRSTHFNRRQENAWFDALIALLQDMVAGLIDALRRTEAIALAESDAALRAPGHAPHAALWNAFIQLFDEARGTMNRFSRRLLDFYYAELLQQDTVAARPASVFLTFTLAKGATQASIPKGAAFLAGTDRAGSPITYAASTSLLVQPVTISQLSVTRFKYDENGLPKGLVSGVIDMHVAPTVGGFPLFGATAPDCSASLKMAPASLGFMVANPLLMLTGGTRVVNIRVTVRPGTMHRISSPADFSEALVAVFCGAFDFWYTTAGGWMAVSSPVEVTLDPNMPNTVKFSFTLPAGAPPMVALTTQPAQGWAGPTLPASAFPVPSGQPAVVAQLKSNISERSGAMADLLKIEVAEVLVDVSVTGMSASALSNRGGPIDQTQSFVLFGQAPTQYDALELSLPELFVKPVSHLSVSIAWTGLPVTSTGFKGYYKNYTLDADGNLSPTTLFDNASFKVALSVISPGYWFVGDETPKYLFQTLQPTPPGEVTDILAPAPSASQAPSPSAPVQPTSVLTVKGIVRRTPPSYYAPTSSALRLSLVEPSYAFGNVLYASNVTKVSAENIVALRPASPGAEVSAQSNAAARIAEAAKLHATAPDGEYAKNVGAAVKRTIAALNALGFTHLQQAVTSSLATPAAKSAWQQSLSAALEESSKGFIWSRLLAWLTSGVRTATPSTVTAALKAWASAHEGGLLSLEAAAMRAAKSVLTAAEGLAEAAGTRNTAGMRVAIAAALQLAGDAIKHPDDDPKIKPLPNPPWIPAAKGITLDYTASATVFRAPLEEPTAPSTIGLTSAAVLRTTGTGTDPIEKVAQQAPDETQAGSFFHLLPFREVTPVPHAIAPDTFDAGLGNAMTLMERQTIATTQSSARLLPQLIEGTALYIEFSAPVQEISLLFVLKAGPNGWSKSDEKPVWQGQYGDTWQSIDVLSDTTNGMINSGIVVLRMSAPTMENERMARRIRVVQMRPVDNSAYVVSATTNALTAVWTGPGGEAELGEPLPAETIKKSVSTIAGLGTIRQPMASIGGVPAARGPAFEKWMAARLRHKGFGIDAWDYARLVLDGIPSLWQVAVVPPTESGAGGQPPGEVWVVAVAGPKSPHITDPTIPMVSPGVLAEIYQLLLPNISPFAKLKVTNPPYLRLKVVAKIAFSRDNTPNFWIARLGDELIRWLSPWPDPSLGRRPPDYTSRKAVAEFVRGRSYVMGIHCLKIGPEDPEKDPAKGGWHYLTSALQHSLISADEAHHQGEESVS